MEIISNLTVDLFAFLKYESLRHTPMYSTTYLTSVLRTCMRLYGLPGCNAYLPFRGISLRHLHHTRIRPASATPRLVPDEKTPLLLHIP